MTCANLPEQSRAPAYHIPQPAIAMGYAAHTSAALGNSRLTPKRYPGYPTPARTYEMPCGKRDIFSKIPKLSGIESPLTIKAFDNVLQ
jgi:hypothetical protein